MKTFAIILVSILLIVLGFTSLWTFQLKNEADKQTMMSNMARKEAIEAQSIAEEKLAEYQILTVEYQRNMDLLRTKGCSETVLDSISSSSTYLMK